MILGALERFSIGELKFKQLFGPLQVWDISFNRSIECHHCWAGVGITQTLDRG